MATTVKNIVATGATSGIGFEIIKQLLGQTQAYDITLGARDIQRTQAAFNKIQYDTAQNSLTILPLELSNLHTVKTFAQEVLQKLGEQKIDFLLLNAAALDAADGPGPNGSSWSVQYLVNHLSQHYLIHLLREKLVSSQSRIVVVSSGGVRNVTDELLVTLENDVKAGSGTHPWTLYAETKFIQLLSAHWWRRELTGQCTVVAVSPGLIPGTGLLPHGTIIPTNMADAKSIPEGAASVLAAFTRDDFPEDPERIFLTSWGEWWGKEVYGKSLDRELQEKWCPSKEAIERDEI
ncbi:NAD(P)-binding protein, partial [Thozetella sp. PMI_491]